ncbi:AcvB/VirJ family lysyl-phosphatidylglycerol hydrolase [Rhodocista pekingensis]|uniref:AcvB/VirJ family lysyl-phosphatidylglycerol hydrolase n=1 Tax=Rhodocista pekingensis TaxID=201185 RepID=A0ABW2L1N0_9PROT
MRRRLRAAALLTGTLLALGAALALVTGLTPPSLTDSRLTGPARAPLRLDGGEAGTLRLYGPSGAVGRVVVALSDGTGWDSADDGMARALAGDGALVAGIDLREMAAALNHQTDGCHWISGKLEAVSRLAQQHEGLPHYLTPVLLGRGAGGMVAYGAAVQGLGGMFAGALALRPGATMPFVAPICLGVDSVAVPGGRRYPPLDRQETPVTLLEAGAESVAGRGIERLKGAADMADLRRRVAALAPAQEDGAAAGDLPVVELPAERPGDTLVLFWSGDGGWRDIDATIGEALAAAGVPVLGIDSFSYFWHRRSPAEVARDMETLIRRQGARWGARRVVLIGFSFGAAILPAAVNALPAETRAQVDALWLLSPDRNADWEINVAAYLGGDGDGASPVAPELAGLRGLPVHCVLGSAESADSLCTDPGATGLIPLELPGDHHFDGDYEAVVQAILASLRSRQHAPVGAG